MVKERLEDKPPSTPTGSPDAGTGPAWPRSHTTWLFALFAAALAVRLAGIGWSLPQVYEEAKPLRVAWDLWGWDSGRGFDGNPHFFRYPSLVIYLQFLVQKLLYLGLRLTGQAESTLDLRVLWATDKTPFFLCGRALSALFGAALVPATFVVGRRLSGPAAAWAAAVLVTIHPMLISRAQEIEVDIPLAFFVTIGCAQALRLLERNDRRALVLAGLCAGLATSSKYTGAILLLPCAVALLLATPRGDSPTATGPNTAASKGRQGKRRAGALVQKRAGPPGGRAGSVLGAGLIVVLVAVGIFALTSPYVLLDHTAFRRDLAAEREHMALGQFGSGAGPTSLYYARALAGAMLGWPVILLAAIAVAALAVARRDRRVVVASLMVLVYLAIVGSWTMRAERYLIPMLPTLIALAMAGAAWIVERIVPEGPGRTAQRWAAWGTVCLLSALPLVASAAGRELRDRWRPDTRSEALRWIHQNVPEGALVAQEQYAPELANYSTMPELTGEVAVRLAASTHRPRIYAVQYLPMTQVRPEGSAGFYDLDLYRAADLVIVTSAVRARYQADPARFPQQCAFYDSLDRRFPVLRRFEPKAHTGPEVVIYRNPDHEGWFSQRDDVPGPAPFHGKPSGNENHFFWNMGVNYETVGRFGAAIECYRIGLRYTPRAADTELYADLATRLAYCLLATRPPAECLQELAAALDSAGSEAEARAIDRVGMQVSQSPRQFASLGFPRFGRTALPGRGARLPDANAGPGRVRAREGR